MFPWGSGVGCLPWCCPAWNHEVDKISQDGSSLGTWSHTLSSSPEFKIPWLLKLGPGTWFHNHIPKSNLWGSPFWHSVSSIIAYNLSHRSLFLDKPIVLLTSLMEVLQFYNVFSYPIKQILIILFCISQPKVFFSFFIFSSFLFFEMKLEYICYFIKNATEILRQIALPMHNLNKNPHFYYIYFAFSEYDMLVHLDNCYSSSQ